MATPPVPPVLKQIQHYLKTATEHDERDPVVSYWCRLYALQAGMKIDRKQKESVALLTYLMDWLEKKKTELRGNEAISNEVVAQAHLENYALKLFLWADTEDRASNFNKNVVKAFYTAGMLFDVLSTFGELTDEVVQHRKYAKWKAAYIHNCLKNGETPVAGPLTDENVDPYLEASGGSAPDVINRAGNSGSRDFDQQQFPSQPRNEFGSASDAWGSGIGGFPTPHGVSADPRSSGYGGFPSPPAPRSNTNLVPPGVHAPPTTPAEQPVASPRGAAALGPAQVSGDGIIKAQKLCKWASSALQYEDIPEAISNLQKALHLLTTGQEL